MPYAKKTDKKTYPQTARVREAQRPTEKPARKQREYVKLKDLDRVVEMEEGFMWLQNGKYAQPNVSIAIDDDHTLSDWTRKIILRNVCLDVVKNDKGYPELVISGMTDDLPF